MRISHFGVATFFLIFSLTDAVIAQWFHANGEMIGVVLFVCFCALLMLFFAVLYGRYHVLDEQKIEHKFLGICYRRTYWQDIKDIMLVYQQTGEKGRPETLMFTTSDGNVYRPDESGYIKQKGFAKEWFQGKIFSIRCDDTKHKQKIIPYVESHYGKIDYIFEGLSGS